MKQITMADWKATKYQKKLIKKVLKSGRLTYGPATRELEERFADIHGAKYALFTNSGTSALKIALHAMKDRYGWKDGDEVIIPSVTFVATMNVVLMNNLKPVLVDVRMGTANINPGLIKKAITKKTRAIIPVHLLGQPADMDGVMAVAREHKLKVIEDSCETMFVNKLRGDVACFSTYLAHLMVTGVGGFAITNDKQLATDMRSIMFHGRDEAYLNIDDNNKTGADWKKMVSARFNFPRHGYSDRATELEAALGLGDLKTWRQMIAKRQAHAKYLIDNLHDVMELDPWTPIETIYGHAFMFFPMYAKDRDKLMWYLENNGIHTRTMMPLTTQPIVKKYFGKKVSTQHPTANFINKNGLLIGCHQYLNKEDLDHIIKTVREFYS